MNDAQAAAEMDAWESHCQRITDGLLDPDQPTEWAHAQWRKQAHIRLMLADARRAEVIRRGLTRSLVVPAATTPGDA